jgi:hypothetical protein
MSVTPASPNFERVLLEGLNTHLRAAAEPVIQQALKDIEREMRERLAARLISLIETNVSFQRRGQEMVITLNHAAELSAKNPTEPRPPAKEYRLAWDTGFNNKPRRLGNLVGEERLDELRRIVTLMNELDGMGNYWIEESPRG